MLFDEIGFEYESLNLIIDNNKLKIGYHAHELPRLWIVIAAGVKVAANPIPEIFSLADIHDFAGRIFVDINAGGCRQSFEFFGYRH